MRWAGNVVRGEDEQNMRKFKQEALMELISWKARWEDDNKMDLKKIGLEVVDWIQLSQDGVQWRESGNVVMRFMVS